MSSITAGQQWRKLPNGSRTSTSTPRRAISCRAISSKSTLAAESKEHLTPATRSRQCKPEGGTCGKENDLRWKRPLQSMISGQGSQSQKNSAVKDVSKNIGPTRPQSRPNPSTDLSPELFPAWDLFPAGSPVHLRDCHHFGPTTRLSASVPSPLTKESISVDYHPLFHIKLHQIVFVTPWHTSYKIIIRNRYRILWCDIQMWFLRQKNCNQMLWKALK